MGLQGELRDFNAMTSAMDVGDRKKKKKYTDERKPDPAAVPPPAVLAAPTPAAVGGVTAMQPVERTDVANKDYQLYKSGGSVGRYMKGC